MIKKKIESKLLSIARSFGISSEIAVRNALTSVTEVFKIYNIFNYRINKDYADNNGEYKFYNPELEEKAFRLTERYFDIKRTKEMKNCFSD